MGSDMKEKPINGVDIFGHFLDHHDMARKVRHQIGPAQHGQRHKIERRHRVRASGQRRLEAFCPAREKTQCAAHGLSSIGTSDIARHRTMRRMPCPRAVKSAQQIPTIGITEIGLFTPDLIQPFNNARRDPVCAVSAPREPHRIEGGIVGTLKKSVASHAIRSGKMPVHGETLLMEGKLQAGKFRGGQIEHAISFLSQKWGGRCADSYSGHVDT